MHNIFLYFKSFKISYFISIEIAIVSNKYYKKKTFQIIHATST